MEGVNSCLTVCFGLLQETISQYTQATLDKLVGLKIGAQDYSQEQLNKAAAQTESTKAGAANSYNKAADTTAQTAQTAKDTAIEKKDLELQTAEGLLVDAEAKITELNSKLLSQSENFEQEKLKLDARLEAETQRNLELKESLKNLQNKCLEFC